MVDAFFANELLTSRMIGEDDPAGISQVRRKSEIELFALIDFLDSHHGAVQHFSGHHRIRSGTGKYQAEGNGRFVHREHAPKKHRSSGLQGITEPVFRVFPFVPASCAPMPKKCPDAALTSRLPQRYGRIVVSDRI